MATKAGDQALDYTTSGMLAGNVARRHGTLRHWLILARRKPLGALSVVVIAALVVMAVFAPLLAPHDPLQTHPREKLLPPGSEGYRLGTDEFGRDVLSRVIYGARPSLTAGLLATMFGTLLGAVIGLVSGYAGGATDMVIQRMMDSIMALPGLILLLAVVNVLGEPSLINIVLALCIFIAPSTSRVVRGAVLGVKQLQYVEGARSLGAAPLRIALQHVVPNVTAPIIIIASVTVGNAILVEATLSFLGLGVPPPNPTWGNMLAAGGRRWFEQQPWLAIIPGLAITITVLAFNLLGDTLRDVLDPRLRGSR